MNRHAGRAALAGARRQRARELLHQQRPVRKARELVVQRAPLQLGLVGSCDPSRPTAGHDPAADLTVLARASARRGRRPSGRPPSGRGTRHSSVVSSPWRPRSMAASPGGAVGRVQVGQRLVPDRLGGRDAVDVRPALVDVDGTPRRRSAGRCPRATRWRAPGTAPRSRAGRAPCAAPRAPRGCAAAGA